MVVSTINGAKLLAEGKPVDSSMFPAHGSGGIFPFQYLHHASAVLSNNPDAYEKIISHEIKSQLRIYNVRFLYLERTFIIFNKLLETDVENLRRRYYKELRANKDLKSFDPLLKVYQDDDFQSIIDLFSTQTNILNSRLTEMLAANNELIQALSDNLAN